MLINSAIYEEKTNESVSVYCNTDSSWLKYVFFSQTIPPRNLFEEEFRVYEFPDGVVRKVVNNIL